jgi:predicted RNA-binding Zn ribbon-like protein
LSAFNDVLHRALAHRRIEVSGDRFVWEWDSTTALERILYPVAVSMGDLLTDAALQRLGQCPGCGWLFLDQSKNRSRTWCKMDACGNRAKARRHSARRKEET